GWRAGGADESTIATKLVRLNKARCTPPLPEEEVGKIAKSAAGYAAPSGKLDLPGILAEAVLADQFSNGEHLVHRNGRFFKFLQTSWVEITDDQVRKAVLKQIRSLKHRAHVKSASLMTEVTAVLRASQETERDLFAEVDEPRSIVNCQNGELWLDAQGHPEKKAHHPSSGQRHTLAVQYDPEAKCPMYDAALSQIFGKARDPAGLVRHWHELVGYLIQPTRPFPIIVVLLGKGANGKTRLVQTVTQLLGPQASFFGSVDQLEGNRFSLGALRGKLLFVDDDVKVRFRLPDGVLKKISEAKAITGEEKYRNPTTFTARSVPFLLCNGIPFLQDVTDGMLRRLHILPFDRQFLHSERDTTLFDRIWATELPGILNRSLDGWQRLKARGDFLLPKDAAKMKEKWVVQANPFAAFIEECVTADPAGRVALSVVYERFTSWIRESGIHRSLTRQQLGTDLANWGFTLKKSNGQKVVYGLILR
ncbi:hypothetical protein CL689_04395, partial [Candidatus Saccharibacteria bacterium]|nr:hypothetical protein [Candidatus Saccharibacteria bacterium]